MTIARSRQLCLDLTPYYHCITRCVRQAYLCGQNKLTKRNYDHRRDWIEDRILYLTSTFCIEVAGYSVMSNHYHLVIKVNQAKAVKLSDNEVVERWLRIYKGPNVAQRFLDGDKLTQFERETLLAHIKKWRAELSNISRFMGNLNETIARKANAEEGCTGRFWEGRFKMQAILDTVALLRVLCYVDLNPVRAKIAKSPAESKHTSVYRRLRKRSSGLVPFKKCCGTQFNSNEQDTIPISFRDYLSLLDWEGCRERQGKPGKIIQTIPSVLTQFGCTGKNWRRLVNSETKWKPRALGSADKLRAYCDAIGQKWIWGLSRAGA